MMMNNEEIIDILRKPDMMITKIVVSNVKKFSESGIYTIPDKFLTTFKKQVVPIVCNMAIEEKKANLLIERNKRYEQYLKLKEEFKDMSESKTGTAYIGDDNDGEID